MLTNEDLINAPQHGIRFAASLGFLDLEESHMKLTAALNEVVLARCRKDDLKIRMDTQRKEATKTNVRVGFWGDLTFQFDIVNGCFGISFTECKNLTSALQLIHDYTQTLVELHTDQLVLSNFYAIELHISHIFHLSDKHRTNHDVISERLGIPFKDMAGPFGPFLDAPGKLDGSSTGFSIEVGESMVVGLTIACPCNEDHSTVWTTFSCYPKEGFQNEIPNVDPRTYLTGFLEKSEKLFRGPYLEFLERLLGLEHIDRYTYQ